MNLSVKKSDINQQVKLIVKNLLTFESSFNTASLYSFAIVKPVTLVGNGNLIFRTKEIKKLTSTLAYKTSESKTIAQAK